MGSFRTETLGEVIYQRRTSKHMSQRDLAEKVGMSPDTIFKYENGVQSPTAGSVWKLSEALDCTPNELLGWR